MIKTRFSRWLIFLIFAAAVTLALSVRASTQSLPSANSCLVGENKSRVAENDGGSLKAIAKKYNIGLLAPLQANLGIDPYVPRMGSVLTIPLQILPPGALHENIVINTTEPRLCYYPPGKNSVTVYPIGIGQLGDGTLTPAMVTTISDKHASPTWTSAVNIRAQRKTQEIELPVVAPAGPDNSAGHHTICLAAYGSVYLLHSTNADSGTGMRVSSGCIRLRDDDIKTFFNQVILGIRVNIIDTPIRISAGPSGMCLVEVYQPLSEKIDDDPWLLLITLNSTMQSFKNTVQADAEVMQHVMDVRPGMPVDVRRYQASLQTL